ncbi:hypothetical protein EMCRGX_G009008 [Ephydatia muelleri]|eukprot:Em0003g331a
MALPLLLLSLLARAAWSLPAYHAPLLSGSSPTAVPGEYVVVLNSKLRQYAVSDHIARVRALIARDGNGSALTYVYAIGNFNGYAAKLSDGARERLRAMKEVAYVEYNQKYSTQQSCSLQTDATWGIVRTTYRDLPTVFDYSYGPGDGTGVNVYIIDTGIETTHPDFGGRAIWGVDYVNNPSPKTDLNGHGTHVAGTVMSNTYGLAKKATAIAVRVLDENGSGYMEDIISGIDWVAGQHTSGKKSVATMSLSGLKSDAMNSAVDAAVAAGVNFMVAAGNNKQNACNYSPASSSLSVAVMASDSTDKFATFSNYGPCAHIIAPGVAITSTWLDGGISTISGTSMATPHVAGVVAKYLSSQSTVPTPATVKAWLTSVATSDKITNIPNTFPTTNKLVFRDCL